MVTYGEFGSCKGKTLGMVFDKNIQETCLLQHLSLSCSINTFSIFFADTFNNDNLIFLPSGNSKISIAALQLLHLQHFYL